MDWFIISHRQRNKPKEKQKKSNNVRKERKKDWTKTMNLNEFHLSFYLLLLYSHGIIFCCFVLFFCLSFAHHEFCAYAGNCVNKYTSLTNHKSIRYLTPLFLCYVFFFIIVHPYTAFFKLLEKVTLF